MKSLEKKLPYNGVIIKIFFDEARNKYSYELYDNNDKFLRGVSGSKNVEDAIKLGKEYVDSHPLNEDIKPTFNNPITPMGKNFDKKFNSTMSSHNVNLNEIDKQLDEANYKLKKKIFSLAKMESLVFSDPTLKKHYLEMSGGAEGDTKSIGDSARSRYGYHANETIMNILFNDYVLNSSKYLQKYKNTIPVKSKRRDASGLKQLMKKGEEIMLKRRKNVKESTGASGSGQYASPFAFGTQGNMKDKMIKQNENIEESLWQDFLDSPIDSDENGADIHAQIEPTGLDKAVNKVGTFIGKAGKSIGKFGNKLKNTNQEQDLDETTSAGSSGQYSGPAAFSSEGDLINNRKTSGSKNIGGKYAAGVINKPIWPNGTLVGENYLTESKFYEDFINKLDEIDLSFWNDANDKYKKTHTGSNKGMGVNVIKQSPERQKLIDINQDTHGLKYSEQDVDNATDEDLKILAADSVDKHTMFPHKDNKILTDDGISGNVNEKQDKRVNLDHKIDNETNAFDSTSVKSWNKQNANLEDETLETGKMDNSGYKNKIDEKAKSKSQQQLFGMARAIQTGKMKPSDAGKEANKIAKTVSKSDVLDFAKTDTDTLPEKIKEDTEQSMISDNPTSITNDTTKTMANTLDNPEKATSGIERGTAAGAGEMTENELFENIERELNAFSKHQNKLNSMMEERKSNSQIINDRVTVQNPKNFKSSMANSGTENTINLNKFLQTKKDVTEVGDNPYKDGEKLESEEIKKTKGEAFKNVGNSGNEKGDEIPKRNATDEEFEEQLLYRENTGDYVYDTKPSDQFMDRMKKDMGDDRFKLRNKRIEAKAGRNLYNKAEQPVMNKKVSSPKYDENINESIITGRYKDSLNKSHIIDFLFKQVLISESVDENWSEIHFDGLGNSYANKLNPDTTKLEINESIVNAIGSAKFYINDKKQIFTVSNKINLNESVEKNILVESDEIKKMKKLLNYKTSNFVDNRYNKRF